MSTQTQPGKVATPRPAGPPRSYAVTLVGAKGRTLQCRAIQRKDGSAVATVHYFKRDEAGKLLESSRGASESCANLDDAIRSANRAAETAAKQGWTRKAAGGGFRSREDAFGLKNLPSPK